MKFCEECNNLLYPREDRSQKALMYVCRNCGHVEYAEKLQEPVFRNEIQHSLEEYTRVLSDVTADPTLPRTKEVQCAKCSGNEAVFFQAPMRRPDEPMALFFVCVNPNCNHQWTE